MEVKKEVQVEVKKKEKVISPGKVVWNRLKKNKLALAGFYILVFMVIFSVAGPWVSPYRSETTTLPANSVTLQAPTAQHWLGTDEIGRDLTTRLMYAGRISLSVGLMAVVIQILIGSLLGAIAGYYGGLIDGIIMRIVDIFMSIPSLPILILFGAVMSDLKVEPSYRMYIVMVIIGVLSWPGLCRIVRGQILSLREQEFMQAAEALGLRDRRKIIKHLLPNTFSSIIVAATLGIAGAILTESALSFLGLGVTPPTPSWGTLVQNVQDAFTLQYRPWMWVPAGVCIFLTVIAINIFGDGLRDALDPKLKN